MLSPEQEEPWGQVMATGTCISCSNLRGCIYLTSPRGEMVMERIFTEETAHECEGWSAIGHREKEVRERVYQISGNGCLRALFLLPPDSTYRLREVEKEEARMIEDTPDFKALLRAGMSTAEREEQLLYETDDEGNFICEQDNDGNEVRRPRPGYQVKNYACTPDGEIGLDNRVGLFWPTKEVIKHVLAREVELGWITKSKAKKAKKDKESEEMGSKVIITRGSKNSNVPAKAAAAVAASKEETAEPATRNPAPPPAGPPRKRGAPAVHGKPGPAPKPNGSSHAGTNGGGAPAIEVDAILAVMDEIKKEVKELRQENEFLRQTIIRSVTALHDVSVKSYGSFQIYQQDENGDYVYDDEGNPIAEPLPLLSDNPEGVLFYLEEDQSGE